MRVLVCMYGTSGCCWNRYGNVLAFEEINHKCRQVMVKTKNLVQANGYEIIRAVVDSVFVKKAGATKEEYEEMAKLLSGRRGCPSLLIITSTSSCFSPWKETPP